MTDRKLKKLQKLLGMKNQKELKKDVETCKKFYINEDWKYQERATIIIDSFMDILHLIKEDTFTPLDVIGKIETAINY